MKIRASIGFAILLAVALSALAPSSASATDRIFKCEEVTSGATFSDAHCLTSKAGGAGFTHTLITTTGTPVTVTNGKTASSTTAAAPFIIKGHISGIETAITCTTVSGSGTMTNGGTIVTGAVKLTLSGCSMTLPANKGCKVSGTIETDELFVTTFGTTGTRWFIAGLNGLVLAEDILIEGCEKERPPKAKYFLEGKFEAPTSGATVVSTHAETTSRQRSPSGAPPQVSKAR